MVSNAARTRSATQLAEENLPIAQTVAFRLKARYPWIPAEDIRGYSLWGLLLAANAYSPDKGVSESYACIRHKALIERPGKTAKASQPRQEGGMSW